MIIVSVHLLSAVTQKHTELARISICNDGTSSGNRRNYEVQAFRGRGEALKKMLVQRMARVENHPSEREHVLTLVKKALEKMGY